MSWRIEINSAAEKQYHRLDRPTRKRIKSVLSDLQASEQPLLHPRMRGLTGKLKGDFRARVGAWRPLMTPDYELEVLRVYAILPRGDAY